MERTFSYPVMKRRLEALWARAGHIQVSDLSNAAFLVRFSEEEDYKRTSFGGPWKIFDYYLTVTRWTPDFDEEAPIRKILTWVRLPKLPIHFFNPLAVERIGNHIGRTVWMDLATKEGARARYARVCVEVDLSKPLLGKYVIDDRVFYIEYESLDNICFSCGMYGHKLDRCGLKEDGPVSITEDDLEQEKAAQTIEGNSGSWMTVSRRQKKKAPKPNAAVQQTQKTGSRFSVLSRDTDPPIGTSSSKTPKENVQVQPRRPPNSEFEAHAVALSKVLTGMSDGVATTQSVQQKAPKAQAVLRDISNVTKGQQLSTPRKMTPESTADEGLVSVPIAFQTIPISNTNGRPKVKRTPAPPKVTKAAVNKKFVSKKQGATNLGGVAASLPSVCAGPPGGGRPPDKQC
ncbi:hypothetical protein LINPERPRIM_LOCUS30370 [Linum perenne]